MSEKNKIGPVPHRNFILEVISDDVQSKIEEAGADLVEHDAVGEAVAGTNAFGWYVDECDLHTITVTAGEIIFEVTFNVTGDQDLDKMYAGTNIEGTATGRMDMEGNIEWFDVQAEVAQVVFDQEKE